jgi:hypothetical protein
MFSEHEAGHDLFSDFERQVLPLPRYVWNDKESALLKKKSVNLNNVSTK